MHVQSTITHFPHSTCLFPKLRAIGFVYTTAYRLRTTDYRRLASLCALASATAPPACPAEANWVCLYNRPAPARDGSRRLGGPTATLPSIRNPQSDNSAAGGRRLPGVVPEIRNSYGPRPASLPSASRSSITNHQFRGFASDQTVPPYRGRVARIVPEFCAQTAPEYGATPCSQRNNELFARGVFCLFNCCTNVNGTCRTPGVTTWGEARACVAPRASSQTRERPKAKRRGGSGCGKVGACPDRVSRCIGRVGPSAGKITRARNQKRPGTSGGGRNPEGEASGRDSFRRSPLMGRLPKGFGP
jgi:hypothetical protein